MTEVYLTIEEAAAWLDPPVTATTLALLVEATGLPPEGCRHTGRPGRPAYCYPMSVLNEIHAAFIPLLARHGGVNTGNAWPVKVPP